MAPVALAYESVAFSMKAANQGPIGCGAVAARPETISVRSLSMQTLAIVAMRSSGTMPEVFELVSSFSGKQNNEAATGRSGARPALKAIRLSLYDHDVHSVEDIHVLPNTLATEAVNTSIR